jgi:hypothetical protein
MGGSFSVESQPGAGSTFRFTMHCALAPALTRAPRDSVGLTPQQVVDVLARWLKAPKN